MAGVTVADEDEPLLRQAVDTCRTRLKVPVSKPLHWKEHVKRYPRRQFVAGQLASVPGLVVNYVIFEKAAIPSTAGLHRDHTLFYNYAAGLMIERLLLTARDWPGGARQLVARFGHVRGFDHSDTEAYFAVKRLKDPVWIPWHLLSGRVKFVGAGSYDGLQAADQYGGMLNAALNQDEFDGYEAHHLLAIRHQIRRVRGKAWGFGFKAMARPGVFEAYPWWLDQGI